MSTFAATRPGRRSVQLPPGFQLGTATAAYQIEGAASTGGRGASIWDWFASLEGKTDNGDTGAVACDHYNLWREDVALIARLGFKAYRFSISWSRVLPDGRRGENDGGVNEAGVAFYGSLIDALVAAGIEPIVTLYHWDLPLMLEHGGDPDEPMGWLNKETARAFASYAGLCFERFGDRVKTWITVNEPWCCAALGYCSGEFAPGRSSSPATEPYACAHNLLLGHAFAVEVYDTHFRASQGGKIAITLNMDWKFPKDPQSVGDVAATERALDWGLGWFADPVYTGDYPPAMRKTCGERLPAFTPEESALLKGSNDFFGLNSYVERRAAAAAAAATPARYCCCRWCAVTTSTTYNYCTLLLLTNSSPPLLGTRRTAAPFPSARTTATATATAEATAGATIRRTTRRGSSKW